MPLVERERLSQCELGGLELEDALAEKGIPARCGGKRAFHIQHDVHVSVESEAANQR